MMFDAEPDWPPTPGFLRLYVADAGGVHRQAVAAGGTSVTEVTHLFFGDRVGRVRDPLGNLWWIQTRIEDLTPSKWSDALATRNSPKPWNTSRAPTSSRTGSEYAGDARAGADAARPDARPWPAYSRAPASWPGSHYLPNISRNLLLVFRSHIG
jgi:hypothetical protein